MKTLGLNLSEKEKGEMRKITSKITNKIILLAVACCLIVTVMLGTVSIYTTLRVASHRTADLKTSLNQKFDESIQT